MDPTEIDIGGDGHLAPLSSDNIPDANQSHYCFSCESPINGLYCVSCGQKNDNYRRSIFSLVKEFFASVTAIESRIWRTWAALLFKPGKVARQFANGRRSYWSSPVRVYIAMSILLFGFLSISQMQLISVELDVVPIEGVTKPAEELTADDLKIAPSLKFFELRSRIEARNKTRNFDMIATKLDRTNGFYVEIDDETGDPIVVSNTSDKDNEETNAGGENNDPVVDDNGRRRNDTKITFNGLSGETVTLNSWSEIVFAFIRDPTKLNAAFFKYLPRIMFLMMPLTMLIGAMFIRGRGNALLYDHLVHAAYIHAVAFFLLLLGILIELAVPGSPAPNILFCLMLIYLPLSLKRMFNRSWLKTIWTSYGVGFIYTFYMFIIMTGLLIVQVSSTAMDIGRPLGT